MARRRERFERSDVPKDTKFRPLIGLAVLAIIAAVGYVAVRTLWARVQVESHMDDAALAAALDEQPGPTALEGNFYYTDNVIEKILFLQVDDADAERPQLVAAQLLLLDEVGGAAHLVNVPANVLITVDGSSYTLGDYLNSYGPAAAIPHLTTEYNIYANHVIVGTEIPWAQIAALDGVSRFNVVDKAGAFVEGMRTDLGAKDLVKHAALFKELGVLALEVEDTPVIAGPIAEGEEQPSYVSVDLVPFGLQTGILVPNE